MYETAHARTHVVEEEYLSLKGAMGNARRRVVRSGTMAVPATFVPQGRGFYWIVGGGKKVPFVFFVPFHVYCTYGSDW
jgi:hypothetical protein